MRRIPVLFCSLLCVLLAACASAPPQAKDPDVRLVQSVRGAAIAISDQILFASGSASLRPESGEVMDKLAVILKRKARKQVFVEGHTDNVGSQALNQRLSDERAKAVREALGQRGVPLASMLPKGYGFAEPIESNATPEGRQANRRAEVVFPGESVDELARETQDQFSFSRSFNEAVKAIRNAF